MGSGWQQSKPQQFSPGTGAGGYYGQVTPPRGGDQVDSIQRNLGLINQGVQNFTDQRMQRETMDLQKQKFSQDMGIAQQKLGLAKEDNQLAQVKYASAQKQQQFDNEMKTKDDARKQVKTQLEMADYSNKEEVANIMRNNIGAVSEVLENGTYDDMMKDDSFQTMLTGLAAVDPEGAFKTITDIHKKRADENKDRKASATYALTESLYTDELPNAIQAIEQGKSVPEAVEGMRQKISELYRSGNIDHKAMTEQLKSIMTLLKSYKTKSGSAPLVSFDAEGNQIDPLTNPGAVSRQVNPSTGKVSSMKQPKKSILEELGLDLADMEE